MELATSSHLRIEVSCIFLPRYKYEELNVSLETKKEEDFSGVFRI
jgi:hypothetical protein